jgi:hypothetical protein
LEKRVPTSWDARQNKTRRNVCTFTSVWRVEQPMEWVRSKYRCNKSEPFIPPPSHWEAKCRATLFEYMTTKLDNWISGDAVPIMYQ